jgi:hypothetical protein
MSGALNGLQRRESNAYRCLIAAFDEVLRRDRQRWV